MILNNLLANANLKDAILNSTNFSGAEWCSGLCFCGQNSVDECVGGARLYLLATDPEKW